MNKTHLVAQRRCKWWIYLFVYWKMTTFLLNLIFSSFKSCKNVKKVEFQSFSLLLQSYCLLPVSSVTFTRQALNIIVMLLLGYFFTKLIWNYCLPSSTSPFSILLAWSIGFVFKYFSPSLLISVFNKFTTLFSYFAFNSSTHGS